MMWVSPTALPRLSGELKPLHYPLPITQHVNIPYTNWTCRERLSLYKEAEAVALSNGDSSRARRFNRGVKTLVELERRAAAGLAVREEDIPPVVSAGQRRPADPGPGTPAAAEILPLAPAPAPALAPTPAAPAPSPAAAQPPAAVQTPHPPPAAARGEGCSDQF